MYSRWFLFLSDKKKKKKRKKAKDSDNEGDGDDADSDAERKSPQIPPEETPDDGGEEIPPEDDSLDNEVRLVRTLELTDNDHTNSFAHWQYLGKTLLWALCGITRFLNRKKKWIGYWKS